MDHEPKLDLRIRDGGDRRNGGDRRRLYRGRERRKGERRRLRLIINTGALLATLAFPANQRGTPDKTRRHLGFLLGPFATSITVRPGPTFPLQMNEAIRDAVRGYTRAPFVADALSRGARYLPDIQRTFAEEGVPPELAYVALVESEFRPTAESWAKARGVWQFMPVTGKRFGLQQDEWIDERSDPEKATKAAARYLRILYEMFGDWNLALAAYNAGEGTVSRAIARHRTADFWRLARARALPEETRHYVPRVHAAITVAQDPERYGIMVEPKPIPATDVVPVEHAVDLRLVATCLGASVGELHLLNPALKRQATPLGEEFELQVPEGTAPAVEQCLASIAPDRRVRIHIVGRGQTLSGVAKLYRTDVDRLAEANALEPGQKLPLGAPLIIPALEE